jgi:ring-1,2-phenylacetyl-CoA epoxidase subunit PaaB
MENTNNSQWDLWEVFVQYKTGRPHEHVGSLHAPDAEIAIMNARDVFARRDHPESIWVVPAVTISATRKEENDMFFDPADDKVYRHPLFYKIPKGVSVDIH